MTNKLLPTGLPTLDKELDGGLLAGSLVYLTADSMTMGEIFLYQFIQQRPSFYVNTERKPEYILNDLKQFGFDVSGIKFIDIHEKYHENVSKLLDRGELRDYRIMDFFIKQLEIIEAKEINLIVDTITFFQHLEIKRNKTREIIDKLYDTVKRTEGLGFLYGIKNEKRSFIENEVINICDAVFDISLIKKADKTTTELTIPKARNRPIHGNVLKFKIEGGIIMDTSREIA
ncbi:MAG: recombinase RecA [Candidatus Methanoperedens sp.]|nr:ATPase domain-containing protein [Candidatus Methanoperedens sp. BLZ2]KAB2944483.1 MAG: recombinase RecA [Candidatus Methanoperedens sp.]MBZ0176317.1 recombinase RecA [Candidatus Methanoperedens nitroreducens]MCX9077250.1 recombinase RecA [Candidatus Methanoperedens sp.]